MFRLVSFFLRRQRLGAFVRAWLSDGQRIGSRLVAINGHIDFLVCIVVGDGRILSAELPEHYIIIAHVLSRLLLIFYKQ
mgnify:CR=1 FL=1